MEPQLLVFTIPLVDPLPTQYYVRAISDRWLGSESVCPISFKHLILPDRHPPHTGKYCTIMQSQKAVTAYLKSKQLLPCVFAQQYSPDRE